ncbi:phosphatase PAP2 family protein [Niabella ginsengisoli]|uniref:Phosphatase PAP2 family protein n=1 Tax=Niabella ginsengisoli TaxID=522298 RepID=A0ABS9SH60_9BACT|nr:phosphatase PAP2 family protein [Niabella ginsengisoli]MCH5597697.1 phosphatase PAP2 family protein [Niabella ginsengisoli]
MNFIPSIKSSLLRRLCCFLLFSYTTYISATAQTDTIISSDSLPISQRYETLNKEFIIDGFKDGLDVVKKPLHWQKQDWIRLSAVMGGVGTLMIFDKQIKSVFLHNQNNFTNSVANVVEPVGDFYGLLIFPVVYTSGLITQNKHIESIGLRGSKAMAITSVITLVSKNIIRRQRPDATNNPYNYALPFSKNKYTSTPSAHSAIAFTLATALAEEFPKEKWLAPVAYSIASLTAVSRIYHNRHWASDVLIGAALGHFVTKAVYAAGNKKHRILPTFR